MEKSNQHEERNLSYFTAKVFVANDHMLNNDYGNISGNPACERLKLENNLARINTIKGNVFGI